MTDEYVLSWILDAGMQWHVNPSGGFVALHKGFFLHANSNVLTISKNLKKIIIRKPIRSVWKEVTLFEKLFFEVLHQARQQCVGHHSDEYQENLRKELLKELTGFY